MKSFLLAVAIGALFALGLAISGMANPMKITGFLDFTGGHWDPALPFVLFGAWAVYIPVVRYAQREGSRPLLDTKFHWATTKDIDAKLVIGSALFGIGWGISGFCPGPALTSLSAGGLPIAAFIVSLFVGIAAVRVVDRQGAQ